MYQMGDLLWIPQGVTLHRKRRAEDDLYSNLNVTTEPVIALYIGTSKSTPGNRMVMINNTCWEVEEKKMKFYFSKTDGGLDVREAC